jgi:hypothetical protein
MEYNIAFDLDGVICEKPIDFGVSFFKMTGQQRKNRDEYLLKHYTIANPLFIPLEKEFIIITARKEKLQTVNATEYWCDKYLLGKKFKIFFLQKARCIKNVAEFKNKIIEQNNISEFSEDNMKVLKAIKKINNNKCKLFFFNGESFKQI